MAKYLDYSGLSYFWSKLKALLANKQDAGDYAYSATGETTHTAKRAASIPFGELDSTSTATVMTATVPGITELKSGVCMWLQNGVVTGGSNFTLNVNGLGAKGVYSSQSAASRISSVWNVNYTGLFVYNESRVDGGCWDYVYGYDSNTNTVGYQLRTNGQSLPMKSVTYRYRILFTAADHAHFVPANNSTSTNATAARTVCQDAIDPFGPIYYYGTTASVAAGSRPSTSYLWEQYSITFGYSFQKSPNYELTAWKPIYLKCAPQSDGSAIIDSTTPFVQSLPSTEDGKIYILLGIATSTTAMELIHDHPIYYYADGAVRLWTNAPSLTVPTKTSDLTNDSGFVNAAGAAAAAPVQSVNGQTGAVSLTIPTVPTNVSAFNNDAGYLTSAPVTSVNGATGAVTVATLPSVTSADNGKVLMVVSGVWAAANLPVYNGGVS